MESDVGEKKKQTHIKIIISFGDLCNTVMTINCKNEEKSVLQKKKTLDILL